MRDFKGLRVWRRSHAFSVSVYEGTKTLSVSELRSVGDQLRRAALSIGANIAEGAGRPSGADYARFLSVALASANEVENHLLVVDRLEMIPGDEAAAWLRELREIRRMLTSLRAKVLAHHVVSQAGR